MYGLRQMLTIELTNLMNAKKNLKANSYFPIGFLRISPRKSSPRYYHYCNGKETYIPVTDTKLPALLAQKSYERKVRKLVDKRISQINAILSDYEDNELDRIFLSESKYRQNLISPVTEVWEQKLKKWIETPVPQSDYHKESLNIQTDNGEWVRSKIEKILADSFYRDGLFYKYEKPLHLKGHATIYPDFTVLSRRIGDEAYVEHFGMMDNPEYAAQAIAKINTYQENGIRLGERLFVTFETQNMPLSTKAIKDLERYLL